MKTTKSFLLVFISLFLVSTFSYNSVMAQEDTPPVFISASYMKVQPENNADYKKLEKVWKKIHEARIKKGTLTNWAFYELASPYGTANEYDFVTLNVYVGNKQLARHYEGGMMADIAKMLSPDEMKLVQRTTELRDMVKEEIFQYRGGTTDDGAAPAKVCVVNFMKFNEGFIGPDMGAVENKYWKPLHQSRVDAKKMNSWGMYSLQLPFGSSNKYDATTVDFYDNMEQFLGPWYTDEEVKKIHPDITIKEILKKSNEIRDLVRSEVWMLVDQTQTSDK